MIVSMLCLVILANAPEDDLRARARALEDRTIEARERLKSGTIEVSAKGWVLVGEERKPFEARSRVVLDGDSIRNDVTRVGPSTIRQLRSWGPNCVVDYSDQVPVGGGTLMASVTDRRNADASEKKLIVDPRLIGMYPASYLNLARGVLGGVLRSDNTKRYLAVRKELTDGAECMVIERELIQGTIVRVWIDPARGHSLIKYELNRPSKGGFATTTYRNELKFAPEANLWFPSRAVSERTIEGIQQEEEVLEIQATGLNQPVDRSVFELAAMNLPRGVGVVTSGTYSRPGLTQWDGKGLASVEPSSLKQGTSTTRRTVLIGLAGVLAVAAAVFTWGAMMRGPRPA